MDMLAAAGISPQDLAKYNTGVILMEEKCKFRREVKWGDSIFMLSDWQASGPDGEKHMFSFSHRLLKGDDIFCAEIQILGAWIDIQRRKLSVPPPEIQAKLDEAIA
jgi:acyl-CoA thioester hydrolase